MKIALFPRAGAEPQQFETHACELVRSAAARAAKTFDVELPLDSVAWGFKVPDGQTFPGHKVMKELPETLLLTAV